MLLHISEAWKEIRLPLISHGMKFSEFVFFAIDRDSRSHLRPLNGNSAKEDDTNVKAYFTWFCIVMNSTNGLMVTMSMIRLYLET